MFEGKYVAVLCGGDGKERNVSLKSGKAVCDALVEAGYEAEILDLKSMAQIDEVQDFEGAFIAMHGDWGEGGQLQQRLRGMGIPYTGSGPEASYRAMNKWNSKIWWIFSRAVLLHICSALHTKICRFSKQRKLKNSRLTARIILNNRVCV